MVRPKVERGHDSKDDHPVFVEAVDISTVKVGSDRDGGSDEE